MELRKYEKEQTKKNIVYSIGNLGFNLLNYSYFNEFYND